MGRIRTASERILPAGAEEVVVLLYTPEGARASAAIYSLIETAKANGLEPYWYLKHLFENLQEAMSEENFQALLPQQIDKDQIAVPTS